MIESDGSTNILYRFMNASVLLRTLQSYSKNVQKALLCKNDCFKLGYVKNSCVWLGPTFAFKITARKFAYNNIGVDWQQNVL